MADEKFYRALEDRFRGSRSEIKRRLEVYLPFVRPLSDVFEDFSAIDLGCGRGEWLELMAENGCVNAHGVDLDEEMLSACRENNLSVTKSDAISTLQSLPTESMAIVSGFHIAEHISFETLQILVREALRVLKPGGLLILETPNPENISVGTNNFFLDPTHQRPLPMQLLTFLADHVGFTQTTILRLQEPTALRDTKDITLSDVLFGVSPDYALVAQKASLCISLGLLDGPFAQAHGLSLAVLSSRFDARLKIVEIAITPLSAMYRLWRYFRRVCRF